MSVKEKKYHELAHIIAFKGTISDFPEGDIPKDQENPDFPIYANGKTIGIELTRVFHESKKNGNSLQAEETYVFDIVHKAKELYSKAINVPIIVWIDLRIGTDFKKQSIDTIAAELVHFVKKRIPEQNSYKEVKRTSKIDDPLSKVVYSVTILRFETLTRSSWIPIGISGAIGILPPEFVQQRIDKKNPRVQDYKQKCDEIWLVIVVYGLLPSSFFEVSGKVISETYSSNFDRTYLFDFQKNKSYFLKTQPVKF